jgi:hypothetical protein
VHWALYLRLARHLQAADLNERQAAVWRWFRAVAGWELLVLVAIIAYVAIVHSMEDGLGAWVAPAAGALLGNTLPLQFGALAVSRAAR